MTSRIGSTADYSKGGGAFTQSSDLLKGVGVISFPFRDCGQLPVSISNKKFAPVVEPRLADL